MNETSLVRLYALRAMYLFILVGLVLTIWPGIIDHRPGTPLMNGVVSAMLGAVSILAAIGLRYPLQMIPVLLFELAWKTIWLVAFALPLWLAGAMDAATRQTVIECLPVLLVPAVLPWRYTIAHYLTRTGDRWRAGAAIPAAGDAAA